MVKRTVADAALAALAQDVAEPVVAVDENGQICLFNAAAERAFGVAAADALAHRVDELPALRPLAPLIEAARQDGAAAKQYVRLPSGPKPVRVLVAEGPGPLIPHEVMDMVHDLKTPIAATKSFIDLTEAFGELNEKQVTYARRARVSLLGMLSLVHEILDMAWMEAGGVVTLNTIRLHGVVDHALKDYGAYAAHQGVELVIDVPDDCTLDADSARLESVISNLASNAIKYSPQGGTVRISAECDATTVTLRVADTGMGIAPEHLPHVFERFFRVHSDETSRIKGSGLGLPIVKTIVEKHGGQVFAESTPGRGSTFGFTLPRHAANEPVAAESA